MKKIVISLIFLCLWFFLYPEAADMIIASGPRGGAYRYLSTPEELPNGRYKATFRFLPLTVYYYVVEAELIDYIQVITVDLTFVLNTEHPAFETGQEIGIELLKPQFIEHLFSFSLLVNSKYYKGGYVLEEGEFILDQQNKSKSVTLKQFWTYPMRPQPSFPFQVKYRDFPLETVNLSYALSTNLELLEGDKSDEQKLEFRLKGN